MVPAFDGSTASSPESFAASQSLIMVMVAAFAVDIWAVVRQPQQARHGAERRGLSRDLVYLGFEAIVVDLLKLRHFAAGAGIDVGAGPDGLAVAVIENDAFAHRTAGDGLNIGGREPGGVERLANALAG